MKQKKLLVLAAAAALFAACSSNDEAEQAAQTPAQQEVGFSAYVNRGTTRAGKTGSLTNVDLQAADGGFGVFAYYTDNVRYSETSTPNFMYNQSVKYVSGSGTWTYAPIKYWPNEFGRSAESDGEDRLTFFAYAPYVEVTPETGRIKSGSETSGIVGLTSNVAKGDPYVKYYADLNPANRVDLCWGVAKENFIYTVNGATSNNNITAGSPYIDVFKPTTNRKIAFDFKHALAWLNVQIDADVDVSDHSHSSAVDGNTKIYVRSVTFEGFATKGLLNLNAKSTEGPLWYELSSTNTKIGSTIVTIYDGRRDGKEGQTNADANNEKPNDLNPIIIQKSTATDGVTNTAVNLFNHTVAAAPVYVIPNKEPLKITIVYDVETKDDHLSGFLSDGTTKGSTVENAITKTISWGGSTTAMEAGKMYTVKLHLGMTSVKFDASVSDWTTGDSAETDVPHNTTGG